MNFNRNEFDEFLLRNCCVGFYENPVILKSGRKYRYYINIRNAVKTVGLKIDTAKFVFQFAQCQGLKPDAFVGIPDSATSLGLAVTELIDYKDPYEIPSVTLRSVYKDHGEPKDKYFVGDLKPGQHIVPVEDVTTTGESIRGHIPHIKETGVIIDGVIGCADRLELRDDGRTVGDSLREDFDIDYKSMTDSSTLVPKAYAKLQPSREIAKDVEEYFNKHGTVKMFLTK